MLGQLTTKLEDKKVAIPLALFCMFLWGSAFPMIKLGYLAFDIDSQNTFGKLYFAGMRFTLAAGFVYTYHLLLTKKSIPFSKKDMPLAVLLSFLQMSGQYFFFYIALSHTTGVKSSILQSSATFITIILAHFFLANDKLNHKKVLALLFGFLGIFLANITKGLDLDFHLLGEGFMLIAAFLSSSGNICVKRFGKDANPFFLSFWQFLLGGGLLLAIGFLGVKTGFCFTPYNLAILLYGSFISSTAFVLWYMILHAQPVGEISIYRLFIPIFGAMLSSLIIPNESFSLMIFVGLLFVIIGVLILNRKS